VEFRPETLQGGSKPRKALRAGLVNNQQGAVSSQGRHNGALPESLTAWAYEIFSEKTRKQEKKRGHAFSAKNSLSGKQKTPLEAIC